MTPSFPIAQTVIVPLAAAPWLAPPDAAAPERRPDDPADDAPADARRADAPAPEDAAVDAAADAPAPEDAAADAAPLPVTATVRSAARQHQCDGGEGGGDPEWPLVVGSTFDVVSW